MFFDAECSIRNGSDSHMNEHSEPWHGPWTKHFAKKQKQLETQEHPFERQTELNRTVSSNGINAATPETKGATTPKIGGSSAVHAMR